jgi:hypothetical protein
VRRHIIGMAVFLLLLLAGLLLVDRLERCENGPRFLAGPCPAEDPYAGAE